MLQAVIENFREKELGGRVFTCMTGSAPTAPEVVDFLRDALIVPIYEGYGSTECGKSSQSTGSAACASLQGCCAALVGGLQHRPGKSSEL